MTVELREVEFYSREYKTLLEIRNDVLRKPLGLALREKDIATDDKEFHFAAFDAELAIGCVLLKPLNQDSVLLRQMAILDRYRGKSIGTQLVGYAEKFAVEKGFKTIETRARKTARGFYIKLGYMPKEDEFVDEHTLRMRKALGRATDAVLPPLKIREYTSELAQEFHDINAEWISEMFRLEATDIEVLRHPDEKILAPGGTILFVEAAGLGIIGTCALQKTGPGTFELTKMGVRSSTRGLKAGEFLLKAIIERANTMNAQTLYLLTNSGCAAAIHLYEKLGFCHDIEIMAAYGARYERCDVAMRFVRGATHS